MLKKRKIASGLGQYVFPIVFIFGFIYVLGCGGGGGGGDNPTNTNNPPINSTVVTGTAAAGAPISGVVYLKGLNGNTASTTIASDGSYQVDTAALTSPFILCAEGVVNGSNIRIYAVCFATGTVNITPITDFILRKAFGIDLDSVYTNWQTFPMNSSDLETAKTNVHNQLNPLLSGAGLPPGVDLLSSPFEADLTGMDIVLEALDIVYQGSVATVTNNFTGSQYTDDVADTLDDNTGLPLSDQQDSQDAISDNAAINLVWDILENLFATSIPSEADLNTQFAPYVADDFLRYGYNKTEKIADIANADTCGIGRSFSVIITAPIDVSGAGYQKGYEVRIHEITACGERYDNTWMVFDGTNWLWYGKQEWVEYEILGAARMTIDQNSITTFETGFSFWILDDTGYAYNHNTRSAIITGAGLPPAGVVMQHNGVGTMFSIYPNTGEGSHYFISDDGILSGIPDGSVYTVHLFAETADVVSLSDSPLAAYTTTHKKRPLLNSELNVAIFPTLTAPTSHALSDTNIPGVLNVNWSNPPNMSVIYVKLGWDDVNGFNQLSEDIIPGDNSVIFDSTGSLPVVNYAQIYMDGLDGYERWFELLWEFGN
jgi:hypothetical protein